MKTKFRVIAIAPTVYQYNSVRFFGNPEKHMDGRYSVIIDFDSRNEAKEYLTDRINVYASEHGTEEEVERMLAQVESGYLEYDAVRAVINEVEVYMIKKTDSEGVSFPSDLKNLSYEEAVEQLNLLEQQTGFSDFTPDRQGEDVLCRNYTDGSFELFEIE